MVKQLIRNLLHSFYKGKDFYGRKTVRRPISKLRKSRILISSTRTRILLTKEGMPKIKSGFYAVRFGYKPGVYQSWEECEKQIKKYPGAKYKKFATHQEAEAFVKEGNKKVELFLENPTQETSTSLRNSSKQYSTPSSPVHSPASNVNDGKLLRVWTDGSAHNNGKYGARAGVGVYWGKNDPRNVSERLPGKQTNNRAEVMAVIRAIETCPDNNVPLEIRTDSKFTINAFTSWIPKWEKDNKWKTTKNKDVEHKELFQRLMKLVRARNAKVTIKYVPGHSSVEENEEADRLANLGAMMDAVDDPYNYDDDDERSEITGESSFLESSEILTIDHEDLDYPLTKGDFFSAEEKFEMENETGMKFV